jgi:hypothetical protein
MICIKIEGVQMLLRFAAEGWSTPVFLVGVGLFAAMLMAVVFHQAQDRATQRLLLAAEAYAQREIARDPQIPAREFVASFLKLGRV